MIGPDLEEASRGEARADSGPAGSGLNSWGGRPSSEMLGLWTSGGAGGSIMIWTQEISS